MTYPPNQRHWNRGDIVIHEADSKSPYMLMVVLKQRKNDDRYECRYLNTVFNGTNIVRAKKEALLDPALFGMDPKELPIASLAYNTEWTPTGAGIKIEVRASVLQQQLEDRFREKRAEIEARADWNDEDETDIPCEPCGKFCGLQHDIDEAYSDYDPSPFVWGKQS